MSQAEVSAEIGSTLTIYFREISEISQFPFPSKEEQKKLVLLIKKGDKEARNKLVSVNLRLVIGFAKQYHKRAAALGLQDLIQEGNLGLIKATELYDPDKGKFSTYAVCWIKSYIQRAIDNHGSTIRIPVHMKNLWRKYQKRQEVLLSQLGREPTIKEMAEAVGISKAAAKEIGSLYLKLSCLDLDGPTAEPDNPLLKDSQQIARVACQAPPDEEIGQKEIKNKMRQALREILSKEEYRVISLRFGLDGGVPRSLKLTGQKIRGLTRERIRQIQNKAFKKLKGNENLKKQFLELLSN